MNFKVLALGTVASLAIVPAAFAGEVGVTNSYGHSFRSGTGTTTIDFVTNSQLVENAAGLAGKIEHSYAGSFSGGYTQPTVIKQDGDDKDKGKGNDKVVVPGSAGGTYSYDESLAVAGSVYTRNYQEQTNVQGQTREAYSFGSTNFNHSVSTFAN
jgi:hypothetical protein